MRTDYAEGNSLEVNVKLAAKILSKTMDSTTPSADRIELSVMRRAPGGEVVHEVLSDAQVGALLSQIQREAEAEQQQAEAAAGDI